MKSLTKCFVYALFSISLSMTSMVSQADDSSGAPAMDVRFVVVHKPGPNWVAGVDFQEQAGVMEHVLYYKGLNDSGKLEFGGPFLDSTGGMMVPAAGISSEEITLFASSDPAVRSGLLTFEIKPWFIAMKKASQPTPGAGPQR